MNRPSRAIVRRRRAGVAAFVVLVLISLLLLLRPGGSTRTLAGPASATKTSRPSERSPDRSAGAATSAVSPSVSVSADVTPVPAWLAWMPGGFPPGFAARIAAAPSLTRTVVVAGDTLWMTASQAAAGNQVDRPRPPYMIPIDSFAVNPNAYAPFLPDGSRDQIVAALERGQAVLGSSSAELRRVGPGGTISFGDQTVEVGAVAPDDVVGWSELLVNGEVGRRLGITHDRYLLAEGDHLTVNALRSTVTPLIPPDTPLRTAAPGETPYVRVASGVDPPVVIKQAFGEFSAYPRADDPAYLNMNPWWYRRHIKTETVPILGQVTCNVALFPALEGALKTLVRRGLDNLIHIYSGCYAARTVARSVTAPPSDHAYGAAIDIDAPTNPYGGTPTMDDRVVKVFEHWGFNWGGDFLIPDGMHFEYEGPAPK
jgi:D-alanyl-D-alanine carboxypeptidase